ncbi:MAG: SgcJ/EcaC family oxidoreductase [Terrimicrobiaceae bacterium]
MKTRLFIALAGLAISFALPIFAQTNKPDPQLREKLVAVVKDFTDAVNNNDAAAVAPLFTEDAVLVPPEGPINGRQAIEKWFADLFQRVHVSDNLLTVDQDSPHIIGTAGNAIWANGAWSATLKVQNLGSLQAKGFWTVIREGDDLKIKMLTWN